MGQKNSRNNNGSGLLSDIMGPQKKRVRTLSVDEETYDIITRVASNLGVSRPQVLTKFVKQAYSTFLEEVAKEGIDFDADEPLSGIPKWGRTPHNNGKKKSTKNRGK